MQSVPQLGPTGSAIAVAVVVAVLLVLLFGVISGERLPVQLTPEVERPKITLNTKWRAAAPNESELRCRPACLGERAEMRDAQYPVETGR